MCGPSRSLLIDDDFLGGGDDTSTDPPVFSFPGVTSCQACHWKLEELAHSNLSIGVFFVNSC
jgi:hypothetical protein